jgi:hypothetical protein
MIESYNYQYLKTNNKYIIKKEGKVIAYSEILKGTSRLNNYFWSFILFSFGSGFFLTGLSSYLNFQKQTFLIFNFTEIKYLPQGILLVFYGTCSILLSFLIFWLIKLDLGSGVNTYDIESKVIRITRKNFPVFTNKFQLKSSNIYLVYPFSQILKIELELLSGLNPKRVIYLILKDNRRIPLTLSNQLDELSFLEERAIFIAKILKVDLKLNINN